MLVFSAPTPPFLDYLFGTGLMETFLWTVGSFYVFGEKWDLTCFLPVRFRFFEKTQISMFIVYLQRSIIMSLGKGSYFFEKGVYFPEKGVYFLRFPLWK